MSKIIPAVVITFAIITMVIAAPYAYAQSYKCKGADGKIEYGDRPCASDKDVLAKPAAAKVTLKATAVPMLQLQSLFADYEDRLCEREKLSMELDQAHRSGEVQKAEATWKPKQDRLSFLNDTLIEFQTKAGKIVKATGADGEESAALRKYQRRLKDCEKIKPSEAMAADAKAAEAKANDAKSVTKDVKTVVPATAKPTDPKSAK